jgi:hypothetical protein
MPLFDIGPTSLDVHRTKIAPKQGKNTRRARCKETTVNTTRIDRKKQMPWSFVSGLLASSSHDDDDEERSAAMINPNRSYDSTTSQRTAELSFEEEDADEHQLLLPLSSSSSHPSQQQQSRHSHYYQSTRSAAGDGTTTTTTRGETFFERMRNKRTAKSAWKKLAKGVDHFLVLDDSPSATTAASSPTSGSHGRTLEQRVSHYWQSESLSLSQCILAVILYLVIAIVAFSFWLPDHFTMIDSCYFAVVTFTTIVRE